MPQIRFIGAASWLSAMLLSGNALAKTLYVETFGDDQAGGNTSCAKALPCASIQHALDNATPGSRVIVGPGLYVGSLTMSMDRVKLISVAGARATTIEADGDDGVYVDADKISVGQKGKGFTFTGDFSAGDAVRVDGRRARVEGNVIFSGLTTQADVVNETDSAIEITQPQATVRYNTIDTFSYGIYSETGVEASKHVIADNAISDIIDSCIALYVDTTTIGARDKVTGNTLTRCGYYDAGTDLPCIDAETGINSRSRFSNNILLGCGDDGFDIENQNQSGSKSGNKYINNVVKDTGRGSGDHYGFSIGYGNPFISRNLVQNVDYGVYITGTDGAVIKDNLFQDIGTDALSTSETPLSTTFSGNTVENIGGSDGILRIGVSDAPGTTPIKQMTRNNFINYPAGVEGFTLVGPGASNMADHGFKTSKNFWGDLSSLDGLPSLESNALTAVNDGHVIMSPSLTPNPVKYKGGL